jgi:hypothetical protein
MRNLKTLLALVKGISIYMVSPNTSPKAHSAKKSSRAKGGRP